MCTSSSTKGNVYWKVSFTAMYFKATTPFEKILETLIIPEIALFSDFSALCEVGIGTSLEVTI